MAGPSNREIAIEQAAVAMLFEAEKLGIDLSDLAKKAKVGILGNASYTWVSDHGLKQESAEAASYLVSAVRNEPAE
ncbi:MULTISPECIES: hypothetical protein [unclassified Pseudomonas]|uniref:hypothetical protein n=1 Tax=unclassified Pseudomonas TaxID=196821 RepID=UPI000A1F2B11|nr:MULTISPECIES: hypothetical protein [unclassified Pseudomonas]